MKRPIILVSCITTLILFVIVGWFVVINRTNEFKNVANDITTFKPYYFESDTVEGFSLVKNSVSFNGEVLVLTMENNTGKKLIFTQQKTPSNFDINSLQGDKEFKTPYGQAFITDGNGRTTGALFTDDGTWILINAPQPIGGDTLQTLMNKVSILSGS